MVQNRQPLGRGRLLLIVVLLAVIAGLIVIGLTTDAGKKDHSGGQLRQQYTAASLK